jgi:AcrR family transcriptional regulator
METTRTYTMGARATAKEETRARVIQAVIDLAKEKLALELTLDDIAARAATSVQTVLRHFGGRDALIDAAIAAGATEVAEERRVTAGDIEQGMRVIIDHYELRGDFMVRMLGQDSDERIRSFTEPGKALHREWVEHLFGPQLSDLPVARRDELTDLLVVATDLYCWKLLRRDRGLDRATTQARMTALVAAILTTATLTTAPLTTAQRSTHD